jgi:hypothetical protein
MRDAPDTAAQDSGAAALGLRLDRSAQPQEAQDVWLCNAQALAVLLRCPARWIAGAPDSSGLRHELLPWVMDRLAVPVAQQLDLLDDVRHMERAALAALQR